MLPLTAAIRHKVYAVWRFYDGRVFKAVLSPSARIITYDDLVSRMQQDGVYGSHSGNRLGNSRETGDQPRSHLPRLLSSISKVKRFYHEGAIQINDK